MKWKGLLLLNAELVDAWRVFPRMFVCGYGLLVVHVSDWYMGLVTPNNAQAAFASAVIGISGPILNWYMKTGRNWTDKGQNGTDHWYVDHGRGARRNGRADDGCDEVDEDGPRGGGRSGTGAIPDAEDFPGPRPARARPD